MALTTNEALLFLKSYSNMMKVSSLLQSAEESAMTAPMVESIDKVCAEVFSQEKLIAELENEICDLKT